jgi:hypothetical protein
MPSESLSPAERTLRARVGGLTFAATHDVREHMKPAQAASPGQLPYCDEDATPVTPVQPEFGTDSLRVGP